MDHKDIATVPDEMDTPLLIDHTTAYRIHDEIKLHVDRPTVLEEREIVRAVAKTNWSPLERLLVLTAYQANLDVMTAFGIINSEVNDYSWLQFTQDCDNLLVKLIRIVDAYLAE